MSEKHYIHDAALAETMAYGEKPYRDQMRNQDLSTFEYASLRALAEYAGVAAARNHILSLESQVLHGHHELIKEGVATPEMTFEQKLDTTVPDLIERYATKTRLSAEVPRKLGPGVKTVRDVLMNGKFAIGNTFRVGKGTLDLVDRCIYHHFDGAVTWQDRPKLEHVLQYCTSIDQVSASVLPPVGYPFSTTVVSIPRLINMSDEELAFRLNWRDFYDGVEQAVNGELKEGYDAAKLESIRQMARQYKADFEAATAKTTS